ncbi:type III secretion system protein [Pantoea ananatis 15320]|uniref:acyl carrier protein n=1 Tax=Pantoea ananas TaxID=553 RepID=UPI0004639F28|nr:acyl carrier protein [Pantoea ananatis]PKC36066.1 type III secretion system protein [Pantoea ananatis 15320]
MNYSVIDESVASLVANLIYEINGALLGNFKLEDSLITDLAMDSIELIDLLMRLEEIGVTIPESDISSSLTVADIIQRVQESS